jgi:hypothetical protein
MDPMLRGSSCWNALIVAILALASSHARAEGVALIASEPLGEMSEVYEVRPDTPLAAPVGRFQHLPGASVQAVVLPGSRTVLAVADRTPGRDLSFASGLVRLAPDSAPVWLCDRVVVASRPLVTPDGRVLVSRGRPGPETEGVARVDDLTIDVIDPATGQARTLLAMRGFLLYLAGVHGNEVYVYRVRPDGADVVALGPDGAVRTVVPDLPPFARDFSIDASGALVFQNLAGRRWVVERVNAHTHARARLGDKAELSEAPLVWPDGRMTLSARRRLFAASSDGRHAAALRLAPGGFPVPELVDTTSGAARPLPAPPGRRVAIAGFVP